MTTGQNKVINRMELFEERLYELVRAAERRLDGK